MSDLTREEAKKALEEDLPKVSQFSPKMASAYKVTISVLSKDKGEWRWVGENSFGSRYMCNRCNHEQIGMSDTCPTCGADMRPEPYKAESEGIE